MIDFTRMIWTSLVVVAGVLVAAGSTSGADDKQVKKNVKAQIQAAQKAAQQARQAQAAAQAKKLNPEKKPAQPAAANAKPVSAPARPTTPAPVAKKPFRMPAKIDALALSKSIDGAVSKQLDANDVQPSPRTSDAEFVRRVYLDLTGVIPSAEKAVEFLDSSNPEKRALLVDELLQSEVYARHQADIWQALLVPKSSDNRRLQSEPLVKWLEESFKENKPWDKFVHELLTASGKQDENGATTFFIANNTPDKLTDQVCRLFIGVQLQCAQCHNHPFTDWKQDEYWGMAAFFMKVRTNGNPQQAARQGTTLEVTEAANARQGRRQQLPESAKIVPAKFFQAEQPKLNTGDPYRPVLAKWLTTPENAYFAKAMVNRTWAQLFGRGFVTPVDDMHEGNPPSHPELLNELAGQFAANGFDLKYLIRAICLSETYQRTSKPTAGNEADETYFSHMAVKSLSPEQLYDSLVAVIGNNRVRDARPARDPNQKVPPGAGPRAQFVNFFGIDEGSNPVEYQAGVPQVLRLMNSPQLNPNNSAIVNQLVRARASRSQVIEQLCLTALSRRPMAAENEKWTAFLSKESDPRKAASDLLWAMLNSSEFALNR